MRSRSSRACSVERDAWPDTGVDKNVPALVMHELQFAQELHV